MARYLAATAMGGKLYPEGLGDRGPWRPERLVYYPEDVARIMAAPHPRDRLVADAEELRQVVTSTTPPAVKVWVRQDLEAAVRDLWEDQQEDQRRTHRKG